VSGGSGGVAGGVRQPRLLVLCNGAVLPGAVAAEVQAGGGFQAGRFRVEAALNADPARGAAWWDAAAQVVVDVRFSVDAGASFQSLLVGEADSVRVDPLRGRLVLEGRDLCGRLIDSSTDETFSNRTASEVAAILAARHGLGAMVTPTGTLVGRYYQADHTRVSLGRGARARSEWDLLAELARREGFDLWAEGETLCFQPAADPAAAPAFVARWNGDGANVTGLELRRAMLPGRGVQVEVRSWLSRDGRTATATAGAAGGVSARLVRANLPDDAAEALARTVQAELAAEARTASFALPGEFALTPRSAVRLDGVPAGWAGPYRVCEVVRRLDGAGGFTETVVARGGGAGTGAPAEMGA
jgi:hypothetical protein